MKKIVIVGGGFAGLNLVKQIWNYDRFEVILVDVNNYHFFPPLLYQVSTAFIEPSNISYPFRKLFQDKKHVRFFMGSLEKIDPTANVIHTDNGSVSYDYLVLALGTETNFFGNRNVIESALPMKTIDDALNIRNHILLTIERSIRATSPNDRERFANIVIAGGGPTGVEMAGMLAEMAKNIASKDYPEVSARAGNIYLIDGAPTLLGPMSSQAQMEAHRVLAQLGVTIILNALVKDYANDTVILSNGKQIKAATVIWSSGVIGKEVKGLSPETIGRGRRILVDEFNRVKEYSNIFAIGDLALQHTDKRFPNGHPQLAQVAIQQGRLVGENLKRMSEGKSLKPFLYNDKGSMAIISKYKAVVDLPKGFLKGFFAWLVWLFIHIIPLVGFRNRVKITVNWLTSFITNDPTLRLIFRPKKLS
ncbi:NAD(P)/FAD-dependent oxidoreductase [Pseudochryseolinea flava]|uniref:NADH:ubiquinone reductase (non-electrogenic) n=1 Tax=Pseudochryseolinea flava TaxID=2059302 RepID=A0A364Y0I4_9BACT|nr:NAD(P)/FAD-dependent oxidoreductase [Pseudochryseolinea flava]RAW00179.1 NAD(P)/FAD-dependent oxidoreductase [Pseudochryseolinea flava]